MVQLSKSIRIIPMLVAAVTMAAAAAPVLAQVTPQVGQTPGTRSGSGLEQRNKAVVVAFYNAALNEKNADKALSYVGPYYKQHNPTAEDGREGLRKFIAWVVSDHPASHSEIEQIFGDGDYVLLNVQMVRFPGERGLAIGETFRLSQGKIVEHWDRIQAIPETAKNNNTMF
jgi:predicted SnoaL-like aldol condensation-catalyzing enzyme